MTTINLGGIFQHNAWCGGYGPFGSLDLNETYSSTTGSVTYKSNIAYETAEGSGTSMKISTLNGTVTINAASNANPVQFTASASIVARIPVGSTTQMTISGLTGAWAAANGTWVATPVDTTHFTVPLDSTALGAWSGGTNVTSVKGLDVCGTGSLSAITTPAMESPPRSQPAPTVPTKEGATRAPGPRLLGSMTLMDTTPVFAASIRKLENFDQMYLGHSLSAAFVSGNTYAFGDFTSNSDTNAYQNERFNFRCVDAVGCTSDPAPGRGFWSAYAGSGSTTSVTVNLDANAGLATVTAAQVKCAT